MPKKTTQMGWALADSITGETLNFKLHTGKNADKDRKLGESYYGIKEQFTDKESHLSILAYCI